MPPVFLAFSLSFLYPMPLWKVGAQFVKKYCTNDAKKSYFAVFYGVSLTSTYCLKTPKSLKIKILKLSPPPTPRPAKPTGEKLKAIFIAFRHHNLELSPPPSKLKLICFVSVSSVLFLLLWALVSEHSHLKLICFVSVSSVLCLSSCGPWCQENSHLKLICFVSVSPVLCMSASGPRCQKPLILS